MRLWRAPSPKFMVTVLLVVPSRSPHLVPVTCSKWGLQQNGMQPKPVPTVLHPRIVHRARIPADVKQHYFTTSNLLTPQRGRLTSRHYGIEIVGAASFSHQCRFHVSSPMVTRESC